MQVDSHIPDAHHIYNADYHQTGNYRTCGTHTHTPNQSSNLRSSIYIYKMASRTSLLALRTALRSRAVVAPAYRTLASSAIRKAGKTISSSTQAHFQPSHLLPHSTSQSASTLPMRLNQSALPCTNTASTSLLVCRNTFSNSPCTRMN